MTKKQVELARHALGLPNKHKTAFRNHFCIAKGDADYGDWEDMVANGMATKAEGGSDWCGDFFYLTPKGAGAVLLTGERVGGEGAQKAGQT